MDGFPSQLTTVARVFSPCNTVSPPSDVASLAEGASISIFPFFLLFAFDRFRIRLYFTTDFIPLHVESFFTPRHKSLQFHFLFNHYRESVHNLPMSPCDGKIFHGTSLFNEGDYTFFYVPDRPFSNSKFTPRSDAAATAATVVCSSHRTFFPPH